MNDIDGGRWDFRHSEADVLIDFIENTLVLVQGEDMDGAAFTDRPFLLQPWQKFVMYNLFGFFHKGKDIRRFYEALINIPKKNGKTPFASAIAWAAGHKYAKSESRVLLTSFTQEQSMHSFRFLRKNFAKMGFTEGRNGDVKVRDNNIEHVMELDVNDGKLFVQAYSGKEKDGINANIVIADEIHQYSRATQYTYYYNSMKAFRNKLCIAITTAGEDLDSFCFRHIKTCKEILDGTLSDDSMFVFICEADKNADGEIDFLDPVNHEKANPSYGVTVSPEELMRDAQLASTDSEKRKDFLAKTLDIYTFSIKAYFNLDTFQNSDILYSWTIPELAKLPIWWFGGVDAAEVKDLTACCLYGHYKGVDIIIPHAFFPITKAKIKAEKDRIDLFAWQEDDWLTMCNGNTINQADMINWFLKMRNMGFKIREIRYDRRFGETFVEDMKAQRLNVVDQPQLYKSLTKAFNRIDKMSEEGKLYYCHSEAYDYCVRNVTVISRPGGYKEFDKIPGEVDKRIDIFAASVFACNGMLERDASVKNVTRQLGAAR